MDFIWIVVFFVLISVVSSFLSRQKEQRAKAERESRTGRPRTMEEDRRPLPSSPGPPVAPGPLGGPFRPKPAPANERPEMPEPQPTPAQVRGPKPEPGRARPTIFMEMRRELAREAMPPPEPIPEAVPSTEMPRPAPERHMQPMPTSAEAPAHGRQMMQEGMGETHRMVADEPQSAPQRGAPPFQLRFGPRSMRRAFVMAEILGKPVTMRIGTEPWDEF